MFAARGRPPQIVRARWIVAEASDRCGTSGGKLRIARGQTLGLVGHSGSGKSTVARCVTRLERPDTGRIFFRGADVAQARANDLGTFRSAVQMVFQDSVTSMNPRFSALQVVEEPLLFSPEPGKSRAERKSAKIEFEG